MESRRKDKRPNPAKRNRGTRSNFVTKKSLEGGRTIPTNDPPQLAYQPWNHITLAWYTGPKDHNFGDLVNQMITQMDPNKTGFADKLAVQMKIHSVRVWNITGKTVALTVYDFHDDDNKDQLIGLMDAGSNTGIPKLGYALPLSFRQTVMRNDSSTGKKLLFTTSAASSDTILQYVRLEWRFDGPVKGPTLDLNWERRAYEEQIQIKEVATTTSKLTQKLLDAQPSTIERIIQGITHHAAEVAMIAEDKSVLLEIADIVKEMSISSFDTLKDSP